MPSAEATPHSAYAPRWGRRSGRASGWPWARRWPRWGRGSASQSGSPWGSVGTGRPLSSDRVRHGRGLLFALTAVGSSVGAAVGEAVGSSVGDCREKRMASAVYVEVRRHRCDSQPWAPRWARLWARLWAPPWGSPWGTAVKWEVLMLVDRLSSPGTEEQASPYAGGGRGRGCRGLLGRRRGGVGRGEVRRAGRGLLRRGSRGVLVISQSSRDATSSLPCVVRPGRTAVGSTVGDAVGSSVGAAVGSCGAMSSHSMLLDGARHRRSRLASLPVSAKTWASPSGRLSASRWATASTGTDRPSAP
jgi:hypothetical protein